MATVLEAPGSFKTTVVGGTVPYIAPEQMQGKPCVQSDIFAMGVISYEMVTGRLPFNPRTPYDWWNSNVPGLSGNRANCVLICPMPHRLSS